MHTVESAQVIAYRDLAEGMMREQTYVVTPEVHKNFLRTFDDRSPIHVDADYAKSCGFAGTVMHGAILTGFVSHFVGMVFPGANSLLLSVRLRFSRPSYLGDTLRLRAKITQKLDVEQVIVLQVTVLNQTRGVTAATGRVQVKVRDG
jgi:3-hydroxybutyryl-CoA dehydratase